MVVCPVSISSHYQLLFYLRVLVPEARDVICREWREMSKEDQLEVFKKIEREELRSQKDAANDALSSPENRYKYLEEQCDIFQRLVRTSCHPSFFLIIYASLGGPIECSQRSYYAGHPHPPSEWLESPP
jgi:hypothetical protein